MNISKRTFPVTGMHCASCVLTVEKALKSRKGVVDAGVNLANATALVTFDEDIASTDSLQAAVQAAGYGLVTEQRSQEDTDAQERLAFVRLRRRSLLAIACTALLMSVSMFSKNIPFANYVMWALATPVIAVFGRQFFVGAWRQLVHFSANMDTLVALSTGIAYLFSVFNVLYPAFWTARGLEADVYFEASAGVICFVLAGRLLEERARRGTSSAIKKLMGLQPNTVTRVTTGGNTEVVAIGNVVPGDVLQVKPGEKIPVDGKVVSGSSHVDESMISGEPLAVGKTSGADVFAGTINQKGSFQFKAERVGADTLLANIIRRVQQAQGSKAPVQRLVDRVAGVFVPVVVVIAILSMVLWVVLGGPGGFTHGLLALVTVLVIACPCALGLATPTAIIVGMGRAAGKGILIKDAESLEKARKVDTVVLDKTGVITEGRPLVTNIAWRAGEDTDMLSRVLYSMELRSEHPLASAISAFFRDIGVAPVDIQSFDSITGSGVTAVYARRIFFAGSSKLLAAMDIAIPADLAAQAAKWAEEAATVVWLADPSWVLAAIAIADAVKPDAATAVSRLHMLGISVHMLTGDNAHTAKAVAAEAGISDFTAEASPAGKSVFVEELQKKGRVVAMVGDGINDAAALAQADVSIAMGRGTDIAMDVAKITLISNDLKLITEAIILSRKTVRVIRQNLFWAFIYNAIGIPLAAGVLYPVNGFLLNPMIAGAAMALSSVSVVANSLRLKWGR